VPVGGALSARSMRLMAAYLDKLGVTLTGDAFIFRNRSGQPYSKDTLGDDFRRSGAVEAITGKAEPAALSHAMGNTLSASNALFATYVPVNATTINSVFEARKKGRRALR
jgi:hypothetical protein